MGLADRIAQMTVPQGGQCKAMAVYLRLSAEDRQAFDGVVTALREMRSQGITPRVTTSAVSAASLARALQAEGHAVSVDVLQSHVYERCGCQHGSG